MNIFTLITLEQFFAVSVRTLIIFLFAFFVLRMLGKKHLSHFTYLDLLLVIALGSAVGDVMIYDESIAQIFSSAIAIVIVGVIVKILNNFVVGSKLGGQLIEGQARLIIYRGEILDESLKKEGMSKEELMTYLRLKGFEDPSGIRKAFIEPDGEISIIKE